jgi:hypothetical protein
MQSNQESIKSDFMIKKIIDLFSPIPTQCITLDLSRQGEFWGPSPPIIAPKMMPMTLKKKGLERRASRFCIICDKNQPLNKKLKNSCQV